MMGVLALALVSPTWGAAESSLTGNWVGGFERDGAWVYLQAHFRQEKALIEGTFNILLEFTNDKPLARIRLESSRLRFEMPRADQTLLFEGTLEGTVISGKVVDAGREFSFRLDRTAEIKADRYVGIYQLEGDHYVHIRSWDEFDPGMLQWIDFRTGQFRTLFPSSETSFFTGPSVLVTYPVETTVQFTLGGSGKATGLSWTPADSAPRAGRRIDLTYEEISFRSGNVTLRGTLILPQTKGPHPVVIFVHPAGPRSRQGLFTWAEFFALHGVAGLTYDKRGVGASSGDWMRSSFQDLAGDALAALRLAQERKRTLTPGRWASGEPARADGLPPWSLPNPRR